MSVVSRHYWIEDGESSADSSQNVDHSVPDNQTPRLRYLYVAASDGGAVAWTLERPNGTVVLQGHAPTFIDFGEDGFDVPGSGGDDLRLAIAAGGSGVTTRGWLVGVDVAAEL